MKLSPWARLWALLCVLLLTSGARAVVADFAWSGAVTPHSARVVVSSHDAANNLSAPPRLLVSNNTRMIGAQTAEALAVRKTPSLLHYEFTQLEPMTRYYYAFEPRAGEAVDLLGSFQTFPDKAHSFSFAVGSCARTGSHHRVFRTIAALRPLFFIHMGDLHYQNIGHNDPGRFHEAYHKVLGSHAQATLYRRVPVAYMWDDHDYGPNNAWRGSASREAALLSYRQHVPHYPLTGDAESPIYQSFTVGRAMVILTDLRSMRDHPRERDSANKTMMGETQKRWFKHQLLMAKDKHPLIFWVSTVPWIARSGSGDGWGAYWHERRELANFIADNHISGLVILAGDAHMLAIDDGTHSDYATGGGAAMPVFQAAGPLDRPTSVKGGPYALSPVRRRGSVGWVNVHDDGSNIRVELIGRDDRGEELLRYEFAVPATPAAH